MNHQALLDQMKRLQLTTEEVMPILIEARIVSDNCVLIWDIAEPDLSRAVEFLKAR